MKDGKKKCETLKSIRKEVAAANGIDYEPSKCDYEGDCNGTCPKCDAELEELQRQLDAKLQEGESVTYKSTSAKNQAEQYEEQLVSLKPIESHILRGEPAAPILEPLEEPLQGMPMSIEEIKKRERRRKRREKLHFLKGEPVPHIAEEAEDEVLGNMRVSGGSDSKGK